MEDVILCLEVCRTSHQVVKSIILSSGCVPTQDVCRCPIESSLGVRLNIELRCLKHVRIGRIFSWKQVLKEHWIKIQNLSSLYSCVYKLGWRLYLLRKAVCLPTQPSVGTHQAFQTLSMHFLCCLLYIDTYLVYRMSQASPALTLHVRFE